jgi:hypothetical protein
MNANDFDFLYGEWAVTNRRRTAILAGDDRWYEFVATSVARPLWSGQGNTDEFVALETPVGPIRGATVRLRDPQAGLWRLYWASAASGLLGEPVAGRFEDGVGTFYGHEVYDGRSVFVRYIWDGIETNACRWSQAFSEDGGASWETNWIMEFARRVPR